MPAGHPGSLFTPITMENEEIATTIPIEMVTLMPNNLLKESKFLGNNAAEDFLKFPAAKKEDTEEVHSLGYSAHLQIAEEKINPSNADFMYSDHANDLMIKGEPGNEYLEMENDPVHISGSPNNTDINRRRTAKERKEELDIKEDALKRETSYEEVFPDQPPIKIENCEVSNESEEVDGIFFEDWKFKNEEGDMKVEGFKNETSIAPNCGQGKHKKTVESNMFRCDQCDYQSNYNSNLKKHILRHKDPKDVDMFKCDQCDYQAIQKSSLKRHLLRHKSPKDVNMFKCDQCDYQTMDKSRLKKHILRHKDPKDINMFKCNQCDYQTIHKFYLKTHFLKHSSKDIRMFKCDHCDYQTNFKSSLKTHFLKNKNSEDINMFKCDQCDYQSIAKCGLLRHLSTHKDPKDVNIFKCDHCDYRSITKRNLRSHLLKHKNLQVRNMFKCHQCDYQSKYKTNIRKHILTHETRKDHDIFKCGLCAHLVSQK